MVKLIEKMTAMMGGGFALLALGYGVLQILAGWAGLSEAFGWGWALVGLFLAMLLRFTLPMTIGVYLCAVNILGWHWFFALLLAAPGIVFMVPGLLVAAVSTVALRLRAK